MYRPGTDPQYRPRMVAPPPPPQGIVNYTPPRQMPPPIHGRSYPVPQFSYGSGPPPAPPTSSHVPSFPLCGVPVQPPPPVSQVTPFVPPLPTDLPPPPPSSPPPPLPPLPSEDSIACSVPTQHLVQDKNTTKAMSVSFLETKRYAETDIGPGISNSLQQEKHFQPEAGGKPTTHVGIKNVLGRHQLHSDWNSTYQDTLDDEGVSPATSDMDMEMEDADHMNAGSTQVSAYGGVNPSPILHPHFVEASQENMHSHVSGTNIECPQRGGSSWSSLKDCENLESKQEGQTVKGPFSVHTGFEAGSSCIEQTLLSPMDHCRARLSRWGSPPPLNSVQNESLHKEDHDSLTGGIGTFGFPDNSRDVINISRDSQGPNILAKTDGDASVNWEIPSMLDKTSVILRGSQNGNISNATGDTNVVLGTIPVSTDQQQEQKKVPTVDEFGRLVQEAASESGPEGEGRHLPVDEFGRVIRKAESGSESEGDRRASKRKRSYSRSRSISSGRSRSRSRSRGRSRSRSRSRNRSRSRSRSSSGSSRSRSSSRSPTRSSGETRWRRQSFSRSPHRKIRWSRSRSRSPQWRRGYSRTPPRDMRWGCLGRGERDWRGDHDHFGRGRRGGRVSGANPCFHFARGRCNRGNACRYLHISRETGVQDRGAWRRDSQPDKHNLDAIHEDYTGDNQNRGQWRRDPWAERHEDFGARHQEFTLEKEREAVFGSRMLSQEGVAGESLSKKMAIPPSMGEFWTSRSALEAKDIEDMAYNKALELVGIPHMPRESVVAEELVVGNNKAQVDEKKFECSRVLEKHAKVQVNSIVISEPVRKVASPKLPEGREQIENTGCVEGDSFCENDVMNKNDKGGELELSTLDASNEETLISQKLDRKEQDSGRDGLMLEDAGAVWEGVRVIKETDARVVVPYTTEEADLPENKHEKSDISRKMEVSEDLAMNLACEPTNRSQEPEKQESRSEIGVTKSKDRGDDFLGLENVSGLSAAAEREVDVGSDLMGKASKDVSKEEAIKEPEATGVSETTVNCSEVGLEAPSKEEVLGKANVQSAKNSIQDGFKKSDSITGVEGEPHVTSTSEVSVQCADSAPLLLPPTSQGQQPVLIGQPAPGILILAPHSQGPPHICTGQPVSAPPLSVPSSQGQGHLSIGQLNAHIFPPGSMQHPPFTGNLPRPTQYNSFKPPTNHPAPLQPLDQASWPRAKYNSGSIGYPSAGGWGQQSFQPPAPMQETAPRNQLPRLPNYGTSTTHQSQGPTTSGVPFYGPPILGEKFSQHHGAPYSGDQFPQQYRPSNFGDQHPQHYRPPNSGGLGDTNPAGYGPTNAARPGPTNTNSGGFGPPNTGGSFSQHHGSSNPGASISQPYMAPSPTGPLPQHPSLQNYRHPFLPQPVSHPNQPTYGASFPTQHGNQNLASTQQPRNASLFSNPSVNPRQQLAPTQQGLSPNASSPSELSQSIHPFAGASANPVMQPNVVNVGFSPNPAFSSPQGNTTWNYQAPQRPAQPLTGQSISYSYPLTTIPPLSGLVPVSQVTSSSLKNDQYDPLCDISALGLDSASKTTLVRPVVDGPVAVGTWTTASAVHIGNDSQDPNTKKAEVPVNRPETAEANMKNANEDVGMLENMSPENWSRGPVAGEAETGQEPALSKKSSRGLKMLRSAIADHVKEVLKPTWREGYMNKEAFKTIAKKAVEKVIGNLPNHHIPKSQEKVDQFMKASRPKISKLVQGYVDKYLKL